MITIVLPVYNEELVLRKNVICVFNFCEKRLSHLLSQSLTLSQHEVDWQIIISDNASDDKTQKIGQELADEYQRIKYFHTKKQGKGYGVLNAWQNFSSDIYIYMDIDLSTGLKHMAELINGIKLGNDIVVGSRLIKGAKIKRSVLRKIISLGLRLILKILFNLRIKDAPCGFKAVNQKVVNEILPKIKNRTWFFDTEMLILAQRQGLKIKEIPVEWKEVITRKRESKVGIFSVIQEYLKNIYKIYVGK